MVTVRLICSIPGPAPTRESQRHRPRVDIGKYRFYEKVIKVIYEKVIKVIYEKVIKVKADVAAILDSFLVLVPGQPV